MNKKRLWKCAAIVICGREQSITNLYNLFNTSLLDVVTLFLKASPVVMIAKQVVLVRISCL